MVLQEEGEKRELGERSKSRQGEGEGQMGKEETKVQASVWYQCPIIPDTTLASCEWENLDL